MAKLSPLIKASDAFLRELDAMANDATRQMLNYYDPIQQRLLDSIDRLLEQVKSLENPTNAQLYRLDRYQTLLQQVADEMGKLGQTLGNKLPSLTDKTARVGMEAAKELVRIQSNDSGVVSAFNRMSISDVQRAVSFVQPQSPLIQMLNKRYGQGWASVIATQYVSGVALGLSPREVVQSLKQTVTVAGPADLDRTIRTAQLYAYRNTNHVAWQQSGVVSGWIWVSALDPERTCSSCWAMHGSRHDVSETLDDHHSGLCAPEPIVSSDADYEAEPPDVKTGEQVFKSYPAAKQAEVAQAGGWGAQYRAYKDGAITFEQMAGTHTDPIYGDMRTQASLVSLLGANAPQYYK